MRCMRWTNSQSCRLHFQSDCCTAHIIGKLQMHYGDYLLHYGIDPGEIDATKMFDLVLEPGQMAIHDIYMVHGSEANETDQPRRAVVLNYMPTTSHFDHALAAKQYAEMDINFDHTERPLFLMRGADKCGLNDFQIGHDRVGMRAA